MPCIVRTGHSMLLLASNWIYFLWALKKHTHTKHTHIKAGLTGLVNIWPEIHVVNIKKMEADHGKRSMTKVHV